MLLLVIIIIQIYDFHYNIIVLLLITMVIGRGTINRILRLTNIKI